MSNTQPDSAANQAVVQAYRSINALIPSHWSQDTVVANGIRHHYYRTGNDKPPVVLLHGFLEGALTWFRTALALEHNHEEASDQPNIKIIRFENTGHLIHREQFDQFLRLVRAFFREQ